jgi:hypothetical protein
MRHPRLAGPRLARRTHKHAAVSKIGAIQPPPEWGVDRLSEFIEDAHRNIFATFANKKARYSRLSELDVCFDKIVSNLSNSSDLFAALLLFRSHSAYRGACRLALSGQTVESYAVLRNCIEYSLYALHINRNPTLTEVWLRRHDDKKSCQASKNEFRHSSVMGTLQLTDANLHDKIKFLYERTIDFGAHPNERGVTGGMKKTDEINNNGYLQIYLHGDSLALEHVLKTTAECGLGSLLVFRFIFAERFMLLGITEKMDSLRQSM